MTASPVASAKRSQFYQYHKSVQLSLPGTRRQVCWHIDWSVSWLRPIKIKFFVGCEKLIAKYPRLHQFALSPSPVCYRGPGSLLHWLTVRCDHLDVRSQTDKRNWGEIYHTQPPLDELLFNQQSIIKCTWDSPQSLVISFPTLVYTRSLMLSVCAGL